MNNITLDPQKVKSVSNAIIEEQKTIGMMRLLNERPDLKKEEVVEYVELGSKMEKLFEERETLKMRAAGLGHTPKNLRAGRLEEFMAREKEIVAEYEGYQKRYEHLREKIFRPKNDA